MNLETLRTRIEPLRQQIVQHELYTKINTIEAIRVFMQHHVVAVWDFMSLLKSLQRELTCVSNPWLPVGSANTRYLINEIVTGEESDVDQAGNRISHFELYLKAMQQMGADTTIIEGLIFYLQQGVDITGAMEKLKLPVAIQNFVNHTFHIIRNEPIHVQAAVFTFGREDLIPDMFIEIIHQTHEQESFKDFLYYLNRHVELDGDSHGPLSLEMIIEMCGDHQQKWDEVLATAKQSLQVRISLWDYIADTISKRKLIKI